jgi:nickel-dependent lactate racemase
MIAAQAVATEDRLLPWPTVQETLHQALARRHRDERLLVLIPDHTRSIPLPRLFRLLVPLLQDAKVLDFMVALGTHPPLSEEQLYQLVGISAEERRTTGSTNELTDREKSEAS